METLQMTPSLMIFLSLPPPSLSFLVFTKKNEQALNSLRKLTPKNKA